MSQTTLQTLRELCNHVGVGGLTAVRDVAIAYLKEYTTDITIDAAGSVIATISADDIHAPTVLLEAHMDEIGFVVTAIENGGFVRVSPCGGVDLRVLANSPVIVWGTEPLHGVFCTIPPHLKKETEDKATPTDKLLIDIGVTGETEPLVKVGDRVSFAPNFEVLQNTVITSKALDNRAGMAAILHALSLLKNKPLPYTLKIVFATGEELGCRGATSAAYAANADAAIVTDVSFAYTPDAPRSECGDLGKGAMCGIAPTLDTVFSNALMDIAQKNNIAYQTEVVGGKTGTDADVISIARTGVRTALLSVPLKYMHTPIETADIRDIEAVGALMAACIQKEVFSR